MTSLMSARTVPQRNLEQPSSGQIMAPRIQPFCRQDIVRCQLFSKTSIQQLVPGAHLEVARDRVLQPHGVLLRLVHLIAVRAPADPAFWQLLAQGQRCRVRRVCVVRLPQRLQTVVTAILPSCLIWAGRRLHLQLRGVQVTMLSSRMTEFNGAEPITRSWHLFGRADPATAATGDAADGRPAEIGP